MVSVSTTCFLTLCEQCDNPECQPCWAHSSIRVTADTYGHVNPAVDQDTLVKALGR